MPGVAKDDMEISLTENSVTLQGKTRHEEKEEKGACRRMEISRGEFTRTLHLPAGVDAAKASAKFKDAREGKQLKLDNIGYRIPEMITEAARTWLADILVIGTHGRQGFTAC